MSNIWTKNEVQELKNLCNEGLTQKEISSKLNRSINSIKSKCKRERIFNNRKYVLKTNTQYIKELKDKCPNIISLEEYKGANTKILHKCLICGTEYKCIPNVKLQGWEHCRSKSNKFGISPNDPGILYLVYFKELDLYKFGITGNTTKERMKSIGQKYEIIFERYFSLGSDAMVLEALWSNNLNSFKVNTGILPTGNTETFKY